MRIPTRSVVLYDWDPTLVLLQFSIMPEGAGGDGGGTRRQQILSVHHLHQPGL